MFRSLVLAIPLVLAAASAAAADIDCNTTSIQPELNACAKNRSDEADKKLNEVYRKLIAALADSKLQEKLKVAERAWVSYRDAEATFEATAEEGGEDWIGGSMYPMVYFDRLARLTNTRTKQLQDQLACQKNVAKCGE